MTFVTGEIHANPVIFREWGGLTYQACKFTLLSSAHSPMVTVRSTPTTRADDDDIQGGP